MSFAPFPRLSASRLAMLSSSSGPGQHRFDPNSGLVFSETVVHAPRPADRRAASRLDAAIARVTRSHGTLGPPTLEDIAARSFLRNLEVVSSETLLGLQWDIGARLWKYIEALDLATPSVWAAFAAAYPDEQQFIYYRASEITPTKTFAEYMDFLRCPSVEWLTCLTLSKIDMQRADIMRLSELSNLVALDIYSSDYDGSLDGNSGIVDDQVVRNWGRRAHEAASFYHLRVLILRNQRHVTARSLEYLSAFPRLALFGVSGCSVSHRHAESAREHGWTLDDDCGVLDRIEKDINKSHTWDGALAACVKYSANMHNTLVEPDSRDPPILSYRLGPTSNNVLYSVPIVFFRCFERKTPSELAGLEFADDAEAQTGATLTTSQHTRGSDAHPAKKRKIKVSAQRSFDSTLCELGVEIARSSMPPQPTSDLGANLSPESESQPSSFPKPASTPATPNGALARRRQARQERERPWRPSSGDKT